jgi:RNA polymerase sigma-70 factor (ECF subfamily)
LIRIAYQMLGSVADAEDVVQEAFLRWLDADRDAVREPEAYLRRVVARLCLNHLKSARHRRETYIGPWLPEPVVEAAEDEIDDVTLPLMMALERLSPLERAAFLLHDVFGASFEEIAETIGREPATCRQLASRARTHVRAARPRFHMPKERGPSNRHRVLRGIPQRRHARATIAPRRGCDHVFRWRRQEAGLKAADCRV